MNYLELEHATTEELQEERERLTLERGYILSKIYEAQQDLDFHRVGELKMHYETRLASIKMFQRKIDRLLYK